MVRGRVPGERVNRESGFARQTAARLCDSGRHVLQKSTSRDEPSGPWGMQYPHINQNRSIPCRGRRSNRNAKALCCRVPRGLLPARYLYIYSHAQGGHHPAKIHKAIFGSKGPPNPRGGKVTLAAEEGMIRSISNRVVSNGIGAFDAELGSFQAAGQIIKGLPAHRVRGHTRRRPSGHHGDEEPPRIPH